MAIYLLDYFLYFKTDKSFFRMMKSFCLFNDQ